MTLSDLAIFTAQRVCIVRTMPWQDVCLSVRPSVCHTPEVFCLNNYTYHHSFFTFGYSPTILVFQQQTEWQYSDGDPHNGGVNAMGYDKITIFDQYLALSRK